MRVLNHHLWCLAIGGLLLSIVTGVLVFIYDPARYAANTAFKTKLVLLSLAVLFHFTVFRRTLRMDEPASRRRNALVAVFSLTLWFSVDWAERAIAFLG